MRVVRWVAWLAWVAGCDASPDTRDVDPLDTDGWGPLEQDLPITGVRFMGTHNSYHVLDGPPSLPVYDYELPPLDVQLEMGVRQFELDAHLRSDGGVDVYHVPLLDEATTCPTLEDCLQVMKSWSDANPRHVPAFVMIEAKDDFIRTVGFTPDGVDEVLWDGQLQRLDDILASVFDEGQLYTPAELQGDAATLSEAVRAGGWPSLSALRGRFVIGYALPGEVKAEYLGGDGGRERPAFVLGGEDEPHVAWVLHNNPEGSAERIQQAVADGYLVRTRADGDIEEPAAGDYTRYEAALASGAHMITTDFIEPHPVTGYVIELPPECNPATTTAATCGTLPLE